MGYTFTSWLKHHTLTAWSFNHHPQRSKDFLSHYRVHHIYTLSNMQVNDAQISERSVDDSRANECHTIYTQLISDITRDLPSYKTAQYWTRFHWIVGSTILLQQPLNVSNLCELLAYSSEKQELFTPRLAREVLNPWIPMLKKPEKLDTTISERHMPLYEFIFCEERNADKPWTTPASVGHRRLLDGCIGLMSMALKRNICGLSSLGSFRGEASDARVAECIPAHIQYACEHWVTHVELLTINGGGNTELDDDGPIHSFLILHILHWVEALTFMGKFSNGILTVMQLMALSVRRALLLREVCFQITDRFIIPIAERKPAARFPIRCEKIPLAKSSYNKASTAPGLYQCNNI